MEMVRITDVSPRDGLQNEPGVIPTADKVRLVELLCAARVDEVEVSSFVSARWVPQLADAAEVFRAVAASKPHGVAFSALVPNERGLEAALDVNQRAGRRLIDKVSVFTAASETFAQRNTNATIDETLTRFAPVVRRAHAAGLLVRGYVSCIVRCPFEGDIAPQAVTGVCRRLLDLGVDELALGETPGAGPEPTITAVLEAVRQALPQAWPAAVTLHLHDTAGRAAECVRAALRLGLRSFDGSAGGLGGCPYASTPQRRAPGNIATETLVATVAAEGFGVGIAADALAAAGRFARSLLARSARGDQP